MLASSGAPESCSCLQKAASMARCWPLLCRLLFPLVINCEVKNLAAVRFGQDGSGGIVVGIAGGAAKINPNPVEVPISWLVPGGAGDLSKGRRRSLQDLIDPTRLPLLRFGDRDGLFDKGRRKDVVIALVNLVVGINEGLRNELVVALKGTRRPCDQWSPWRPRSRRKEGRGSCSCCSSSCACASEKRCSGGRDCPWPRQKRRGKQEQEWWWQTSW